MQKYRDRTVGRTLLIIGDVERTGIDVTKRLQTPRRGRA
jgi:hypothetical protein